MVKETTKPKIGIVCPYDYYRHGGVQEHVKAEYHELTNRGYDVKIIAPQPTDNDYEIVDHVILLGKSTAMRLNAPFHTLFDVSNAESEDIIAMLEAEQFDLLHVHEPWLPMMPYQILQNNEKAVVVGTLHATWPDTAINNSIQKMITPYVKPALKRLDYITAVSEAPAKKILDLTDAHINYIPNGIDLATYNPDKVPYYEAFNDGVNTIFYIGRLEKRKGVEYLIKAYAEVRKMRKTPLRLVLAGDGPKRKSLESYVERFEVPDVHFLGRVSDEDKLSLLKTCTLFCSPAIFGESFGIVLLEAMAMHAPIVAGFNEGYQTVLSGVGQLAMVDPKNREEFARRLSVMLDSPEVRDMLVEWGKREIIQYDYPKIVAQYDELFTEIMRDKND